MVPEPNKEDDAPDARTDEAKEERRDENKVNPLAPPINVEPGS